VGVKAAVAAKVEHGAPKATGGKVAGANGVTTAGAVAIEAGLKDPLKSTWIS